MSWESRFGADTPWWCPDVEIVDEHGINIAFVHETDAPLFVAAPDLLEALHRIAYGLETDGRTADGITRSEAAFMARSAIAKAEAP